MSSVFGKAKFGGNKRTWFKLKDGEVGPFRILPPMGDLAEDGRWSVFYKIHYGYKNSKGEMRTFQSTELINRKTKMVEIPDAALDRINQLKAKLDEAKKSGNDALVKQLLDLVGGKKSRFNLDSNHYMNVIDLQGNIGILKIRHRAKMALDVAIKALRDKGIEPLDPENGRFFLFTRSGIGRETTYAVSVYKKRFNLDGVGEVEQDVVHTITPDIARRCLVQNQDGTYTYKEATRLDTLFKKPSAEEVARIVRDGEKAVDEILDAKYDAASSSEDDSGLEDDDSSTPTKTTSLTAPAATPAPVAAAPAQTATLTATATTVQAAPPAQSAAAAPTPAPTPAPAQNLSASGAPKTTAQTVTEMTDEEFLRSLNL